MQYEQINALGDFAPMHKWDLTCLKSPVGVDMPTDLNIRLLATDVPKTDAGQTTDVWIRGIRIRQPGIMAATPNLNMIAAETADYRFLQALAQWRQQCFNIQNGVQARNADVKAIFQLVRKNRQDIPVYVYIIKGCFLEDYDPAGGQLDGENSDIVRPSLTLSIDTFTESPL
ncbi:hypothetical protein Voja6_00157 [Pseudomonas phage vB_PpuM-Voja-6]